MPNMMKRLIYFSQRVSCSRLVELIRKRLFKRKKDTRLDDPSKPPTADPNKIDYSIDLDAYKNDLEMLDRKIKSLNGDLNRLKKQYLLRNGLFKAKSKAKNVISQLDDDDDEKKEMMPKDELVKAKRFLELIKIRKLMITREVYDPADAAVSSCLPQPSYEAADLFPSVKSYQIDLDLLDVNDDDDEIDGENCDDKEVKISATLNDINSNMARLNRIQSLQDTSGQSYLQLIQLYKNLLHLKQSSHSNKAKRSRHETSLASYLSSRRVEKNYETLLDTVKTSIVIDLKQKRDSYTFNWQHLAGLLDKILFVYFLIFTPIVLYLMYLKVSLLSQ